jgi:hypothetical protein
MASRRYALSGGLVLPTMLGTLIPSLLYSEIAISSTATLKLMVRVAL